MPKPTHKELAKWERESAVLRVNAESMALVDALPKRLQNAINYCDVGWELETLQQLVKFYERWGEAYTIQYIRQVDRKIADHYNKQVGLKRG